MILPPATLGMLGGGQLGRFFVIAAHELGYRVVVLDPDAQSPAGRIADQHLVAAYDDPDALNRMAESCVAVTTEFENVPADSLAYLSKFLPVRPSAEAVAISQNRSAEKGFLKQHRFPHAPYADVRSETDIAQADAGLFPGILKVARFGYDGKGQARVATAEEARSAFASMGGAPCVLERRIKLRMEISVVLARDAEGRTTLWPVAENQHKDGILDQSIVPARIAPELAARAGDAALNIARALDYRGVLCVEFFIDEQGALLVNEFAPRPHNSGHSTLDASRTSQFEQQVRVLAGLPLGDTRTHSPAVMQNLLGELWAGGTPQWPALLAAPGAKLHLYGKAEARQGRKMGHYTCLAASIEAALAASERIRDALPAAAFPA